MRTRALPGPQTLFARISLLIATALFTFSLLVVGLLFWPTMTPATDDMMRALEARAEAALTRGVLSPGDRFDSAAPQSWTDWRRPALAMYVSELRSSLRARLAQREIRIVPDGTTLVTWIATADPARPWLVLHATLLRPPAPLGMVIVLLLGATISLAGAAAFARRMTAPLADLAAAAARIADGESVAIDASRGPSELRSMAVALQSMADRLAEVDQQRELVLAGISHDLRSPLARLRVAVELQAGGDPQEADAMIADVEAIDRTVGRFLHYARASQYEPPTPIVPDAIVDEALRAARNTGELHLDLNAERPARLAPDGLRQIVVNLVENAFQHGRSPVVVRTHWDGGELVLEVRDRGPGLSPEQFRRAVRPFERLDAKPGDGHTGLGLALVDRRVRSAGGQWRAVRDQTGFRIEVRLPEV